MCARRFKLPPSITRKPDEIQELITIEEIREIWNDKKMIYSDSELMRIRNWMNSLMGVVFNVSNKVITLNKEDGESKSDTLHSGEYRRAS
jgi:hypothetical protein